MLTSLRKISFLVVHSALLFGIVIPVLLPASLHAETRQELVIGGLFDLTGGGALWGRSEKNAFIMACQDFEAQHPTFKVRTVLEDTLFSNRQTVTALHKIISVDKVRYVIGATWETTVAMMPICEQRKVICISPSYHGKEYYAKPWRYNFTAWFDDRRYSTALAEEMKTKGYKKTVVFAALTPYYDSLVEDFMAKTSSHVLSVERVPLDERDFKTIITKVKADVDSVVMLLDNAGQIQAFLKQWSDLRKDRPEIFSDDLITYLEPPDDITRYGFSFYYAYPVFDPSGQSRFKERYVAVFNEPPQGASATVAYDETMILLSCVAKGQTVELVRDCVANTNNYQGVSGTFSFGGSQTVRDRVISVRRLTAQ